MKKFALLLTVALPMMIASCGDDNDATLKINEGNITISYEKSSNLTASEKNVTWSSDNEFVATVDSKGKVEAKHVGTCNIYAKKDGKTAAVEVTVVPTDNSFVMPYLTWKASVNQVKSAFTGFQLYSESNTELQYFTDVKTFSYPAYLYSFNAANYNGLYQADLIVTQEQAEMLYPWLEQYYEEVTTDEDLDLIFVDDKGHEIVFGALTDNATGEELGYWSAIWTAPDYTTKSASTVKEAKAAAIRMIKNAK